ncbi:unnamed protein product, partial [Owenia fusiformis]
MQMLYRRMTSSQFGRVNIVLLVGCYFSFHDTRSMAHNQFIVERLLPYSNIETTLLNPLSNVIDNIGNMTLNEIHNVLNKSMDLPKSYKRASKKFYKEIEKKLGKSQRTLLPPVYESLKMDTKTLSLFSKQLLILQKALANVERVASELMGTIEQVPKDISHTTGVLEEFLVASTLHPCDMVSASTACSSRGECKYRGEAYICRCDAYYSGIQCQIKTDTACNLRCNLGKTAEG